MVDTARALVHETGARFGYTQSDEITLVLHAEGDGSMLWFDGRVQKTVSQLAAYATGVFNLLLPAGLPEKAAQRAPDRLPTFDARAWTVPSRAEACDVVLWRALDATRNSVAMAARARFSHRETDRKDTGELRAMLAAADAPWEAMPEGFRYGTMVQRRRVQRPFSAAEIEHLPPRSTPPAPNPGSWSSASSAARPLPRFDRVANPEAVIFDGADAVATERPRATWPTRSRTSSTATPCAASRTSSAPRTPPSTSPPSSGARPASTTSGSPTGDVTCAPRCARRSPRTCPPPST